MKTKNVILGLAALVFALGSAFTSIPDVAPDYISVKFDGQANFECIELSETLACNSTNPQNPVCTINVTLKNGTIVAAPVYDLDTDQVTCTTVLRHTTGSLGSFPGTGTPIIAVQ